ncbi:MAG: efflux RND transporter periplasmic adaptor subunit [Alphaproteobacteria bacterium]|nr:efflux RND transporter periplasmic adaptor subunit [Alphaproteobacteria bacterium]
MKIKGHIVLVILLSAAVALGWYLFEGRGGDNGKKGFRRSGGPVVVSIVPVQREDVPLSLSAIGNAVTYQSVAVRARIDSQLMTVSFKDGDYVEEGDLLFTLDDRAIKAQLRQQEANLARDRAQMQNLKRQYDRKKNLADKGFETTSNLDEARAQYEVQQATIKATEAAIENLKVQLQYTEIHAPISGRTGTINVTVGNNVRPGDSMPLVTINQVKPIRAQVSIPQKYLPAVREAMRVGSVPVHARGDGGGAKAEGVLDYIDNMIDASTGTFTARASFANENEALWPGMFVTATIDIGLEKNRLTVPEVAIQHGQSGDFVFVIAENTAHKKSITVDRMYRGTAVIGSGLDGTEQVAVDGLMRLEEGASVTVPDDGGE